MLVYKISLSLICILNQKKIYVMSEANFLEFYSWFSNNIFKGVYLEESKNIFIISIHNYTGACWL